MDILLINASAYALPVSRRAGAIVYDGTRDLGLWRPPGPDRELVDAYGDLGAALEKERVHLGAGGLEPRGVLRLHPGKLRCDFLIWLGGRGPHGATSPATPPSLDEIEVLARRALEFAAERNVLRVAFGPMGEGPGAAPVAERMAAVVRGAAAYRDACRAAGRASPVEEVFVCAPSAAEVAKAKRLVARLAKADVAPPPRPAQAAAAPRSRRSASGSARTRTRSAASRLDPDALTRARVTADAYDRTRAYVEGDWFVHPKFGVGQVRTVMVAEQMVTALFEDGQERRLIHDRR